MASAAPKTISAKPEAELIPRRQDEVLNSDELSQLDLFGNLKKKISVEKFPGSIVLRRFRQGEVICRQGDRGHSAFYIVRAADIQALRGHPSRHDARGPGDSTDQGPLEPTGATRPVATAYLFSARPPTVQPGFLRRMFSSHRRTAQAAPPEYIPIDGPSDIDYHTRQAPMFEGDVFGEMSCMTLAPRSATVVADEDCFMVEFQRNIFDQMQKDAGYRARIDQLYEQRVLSNHLRRLDLFRDLDDAALAVLRAAAQLEVVEPGTVICNEGDASDGVYLIRSGVVQVVHGAHVAFQLADVADWSLFCQALMTGAPSSVASAPVADPTHPPTTKLPGGTTADILAAARAKAATGEGPKKPVSAKPGGASPAGILAAARAAKAKPQPSEADVTKPPNPTPPATSSGGGKNPLEILAAARAGAGESPQAAARPPEHVPAAADIIAAAKTSPAANQEAVPSDTSDVAVASLLQSAPPAAGDPRGAVWAWLRPTVQQAIRALADGSSLSDDDRRLVIRALNQLVRNRDFIASTDLAETLEHPHVAATVKMFPRGAAGAKSAWSDLEVRIAGDLALQVLYPTSFRPGRLRAGPRKILDYMARGDCFGELGVVLHQPRQATCLAYDHPSDDPSRKPGRVELVRIAGEAFRRVLESHPQVKSRVEQFIAERQQNIARAERAPPWDAEHGLSQTQEFRDQGLIQGQKLLLIDLDRCTRCGDCVRACVHTHDDGYSRLFLDGPRFDRFLVPSACRQCLNPACMIGCPVGSIQRGDNGQIEIRDWCIGCGLCARQCPYDSIQMHDVGVIPHHAVGWQFAPWSSIKTQNWQSPRYRPRRWQVGATPFRWTLDLFDQLAVEGGLWGTSPGSLPEPICFRYRFDLSAAQLEHETFRLHLVSEGCVAEIWLNGESLAAPQDAKQAKHGEYEATFARSRLARRGNVLAVRITPPEPGTSQTYIPKYNQHLLGVRLDPVPSAGKLTEMTASHAKLEVELVTDRAVVCDLCSSLPGQEPACVAQCPHDAAMRIDARFEFPEA